MVKNKLRKGERKRAGGERNIQGMVEKRKREGEKLEVVGAGGAKG